MRATFTAAGLTPGIVKSLRIDAELYGDDRLAASCRTVEDDLFGESTASNVDLWSARQDVIDALSARASVEP